VAHPLATGSVEPYDELIPTVIEAQAFDHLPVDVSAELVHRPMTDCTDTAKEESQWKAVTEVLSYEGRMYVQAIDSLRGKVISLIHDIPESCHFGALKTPELGSKDFCWPVMDLRVREYISGCLVCHRIKVPQHARHGINMPLEAPSWPWRGVTLDLVANLPESTASGYTRIHVIRNRRTKMAIYLPCRKDVDSPELARLFVEHVIGKPGIPDNIVTDCGTQFTSRFWT